jgi:hypothetical protein
MIFINDVRFVKCWEVLKSTDTYTRIKASTSEKKQDGTYENSSWFVTLVSKANVRIEKGDTFTIKKGKITNVYNKDKQTSYLNVVAFEIEVDGKKQEPKREEYNGVEGFQGFNAMDDDIPFMY